jgi:hypothetical protein
MNEGNYFKVGNEVVGLASKISHLAFRVYILLRRFANNGTATSNLSCAALARACGVKTKKPILKAIRELKVVGMISIDPRGGGGRGRNRYSAPLHFALSGVPADTAYSTSGVREDTGTGVLADTAYALSGVPADTTIKDYKNKTNKKKTKARHYVASLEDVPIKESHNVEPFRRAWGEWIRHRDDLGPKHRLTLDLARRQLDDLYQLPVDKATECLNDSLRNGWVGFFPQKYQKNERPSNHHVTRIRQRSIEEYVGESPPGEARRSAVA